MNSSKSCRHDFLTSHSPVTHQWETVKISRCDYTLQAFYTCTFAIPLKSSLSKPAASVVCMSLNSDVHISLDQYRSRVGTFHGIYYGKFASSGCYITISWVCILLSMLKYIFSYLIYSRNKPRIRPLTGYANLIAATILIITFAQFILKQCGDTHPNPGPHQVASNNIHGISICHANVNGIKENLRHIRATLAGHFAVIALTETHLSNRHNIDLSIQGYYPIFQKDRQGGTDSWGGEGAYVASSLFVKRRPDLEVQSIENMWLEIRHNNFKLLLCVSYRPPNSSLDFWGDFQYQIDLAKSGNVNHVAIVGDLNADPSTNHGTHLTRVTTNNNFTIHVTEPTRYAYQSATILDQIITNIPHLVFDVTILSPVGSSDHHCVSFNSFFLHHSHIDTSNAQLPSNSNLPECALTNINVTENDVTGLLKDIDVSKATGPDGISPRLLKEAGSAISKPLSKLFNLSLEIKTVPEIWKRANVIPIYKIGEKTKIDNYRPISLLSCVGKLCERVVLKYVFNYFRTSFLLSIYQSGFQPGDATVNQLIKVYHMLCEALDSKKEVRIVFCDISKAFDRVWHDGLVYKLKRMGIRGSLLSWFIHYFVKVGALYLPFSQGPCEYLTAGLSVRNVSIIKV